MKRSATGSGSATAKRAKILGLTAPEVTRLGLRDLSAREARTLCGVSRPGIIIPYFDFIGRPSHGDLRVRFGDGELPKYGQPRGTAPRVYLPPLCNFAALVQEPEPTTRTPRTP